MSSRHFGVSNLRGGANPRGGATPTAQERREFGAIPAVSGFSHGKIPTLDIVGISQPDNPDGVGTPKSLNPTLRVFQPQTPEGVPTPEGVHNPDSPGSVGLSLQFRQCRDSPIGKSRQSTVSGFPNQAIPTVSGLTQVSTRHFRFPTPAGCQPQEPGANPRGGALPTASGFPKVQSRQRRDCRTVEPISIWDLPLETDPVK